ncbi:phage tail protein [Sphingomonas sp.]|uniref:phage tail protein n=1 Tax=Sphingomonas sp. TaxID=28214 RepID=UPI00307E14D5
MNKIDTLRAAIVTATPELAIHPARLRMWVDRGEVEARQTASGSFGFSFRLNVLIMELATDVSVISAAIIQWLRVNQPDRLAPGNKAFTFDVDILDNDTVDLLIEIQITQQISRQPAPGGGFTLTYLPEPDPLFGDDLGLGGVAPAPNLVAVSADGESILPHGG